MSGDESVRRLSEQRWEKWTLLVAVWHSPVSGNAPGGRYDEVWRKADVTLKNDAKAAGARWRTFDNGGMFAAHRERKSMPKRGKRQRLREAGETVPDVDTFLFGSGLSASDYFISGEGLIGFKDENGREFDLIIDHPRLADAAMNRLQELGLGRLTPNVI